MADEPGISYMKMTMILADSVCVEDVLCGQNYYLSFSLAFSTRLHVPAPKTRISLLFYTVWSESSHGTLWIAKDPKLFQADSEGSDYENTPIQMYRKFYLQKLKIFR